MSKTTNKFSPEVRERALRLVLDKEGQHESRRRPVGSVSAKARRPAVHSSAASSATMAALADGATILSRSNCPRGLGLGSRPVAFYLAGLWFVRNRFLPAALQQAVLSAAGIVIHRPKRYVLSGQKDFRGKKSLLAILHRQS